VAELRERGVPLVAGNQDIPAALDVGADADRGQLPEQRDRLRERVDLIGLELLADVLVVADLAQSDHLHADRLCAGGHQALL
jgi:hypothetical protein